MRGKNKSESHCTETAQHHHHHESSFLIYIYYIIYSRLPCVWLQCPSNGSAYRVILLKLNGILCVRNSVWKQKNVFVEWLAAVYRRIKFFIFSPAYLLYVVCIYIRLPLLGWIMSCHAWQDCRIWFVGKPDSRDDVTSLGAAHKERPAQGREDTLYNNIPCIQKYQHVFFLKKKMFPRLVTDEKENLIYKENYFLLKPTLKKKRSLTESIFIYRWAYIYLFVTWAKLIPFKAKSSWKGNGNALLYAQGKKTE